MKNMEGPSNAGKESRRDFLKKLGILGAGLVLAPEKVFSNSNPENNESNRIIESSEMIEMENGGNLPDGFKRTKINLEFNDERGKIEGAGSMFMFDNNKGKAEFISKKSNPYFFAGGVDFDKLKHDYEKPFLKLLKGIKKKRDPNDKDCIIWYKGDLDNWYFYNTERKTHRSSADGI
jgi:hypothetical protein